ncbi:hypothetical protein L7F22_038385 [Adiantum nelumboides]|nr:hypothetical protein [Adiantum nelumboides]
MAASAPVLGTTQDAPRPITWTYELTPEDETEMQTAIEHFSGRTLVGRLVGTTPSRPTVRKWIESALGGSTAIALELSTMTVDFDPLQALHARDLLPPNPRVRPLDNLSSCRRILPEAVPESIINAPAKAPRSVESIQAQERAKAHKSVLLQKAAERERQVKIFDKIAEKLKQGPLSLLVECYQRKLRIKVWTRHTHGVRGTLTGSLIAFDKHINLVLRDIDEEYSVRRWIPRLVRRRGRSACNEEGENTCCQHASMDSFSEARSDQCTQKKADGQNQIESLTSQLQELRMFPKLEHRRRHLKQVFLRGDSVVIIQKLL